MIKLDIDQIVLDGFNMTPGRAEHIKSLLEKELQHKISQRHKLNGLGDKDISARTAAGIRINESQSDGRIATGLAESIIGALGGMNNKKGM